MRIFGCCAQAPGREITMRQLIVLIFLAGTYYCSFGQDTKVNLVIKLNDKLLEEGVSNTHLAIETDKDKYNVGVQYYTGDLNIDG